MNWKWSRLGKETKKRLDYKWIKKLREETKSWSNKKNKTREKEKGRRKEKVKDGRRRIRTEKKGWRELQERIRKSLKTISYGQDEEKRVLVKRRAKEKITGGVLSSNWKNFVWIIKSYRVEKVIVRVER